jgi:putative FmdB family regulatory protein
MPIYEYRCNECHQVFEEWTKHMEDAQSPLCPICDSPAERIISNTSFVLKGEGWYVTDYGYKNKKDAPAAESETVKTDAPAAPVSPPAGQPALAPAAGAA